MTTRSNPAPFLLSTIAGVLLFVLAALLTTRREPWDSSSYWMLIYPLSIACSAYMAYRYPERPWRWALTIFEAQFFAMAVRNGELGNLWPIGMVLFAIVAIPAVLAAKLVSYRKLQVS